MPKLLLNLFVYFALMVSAWAHHPGHSHGGHANLQLIKGGQSKPSSQAFLNYTLNFLDESVGENHQWLIGGEWAFHKKMSLLGYLPFTYLSHNFRNDDLGLGDMGLGLKWQFSEYKNLFGYITATTTFPTGSFGQQLDLLLGYSVKQWTIYGDSNINFTYESPHQPVMGFIAGTISPRILKKIYFNFALDAQVFLVSNVLTHRSWKLYLEPQIYYVVDKAEHWTVSLGGKFTVLDDLHRQAGVAISNTDSILLSDTLWGLNFGVNYRF